LSVPLIQTRASLISGLLLKRGPTGGAKFFQCALSVLTRCQKSKPQKPCQLFSLLLKNAPHCPLHQVSIFSLALSMFLCMCGWVCACECARAIRKGRSFINCFKIGSRFTRGESVAAVIRTAIEDAIYCSRRPQGSFGSTAARPLIIREREPRYSFELINKYQHRTRHSQINAAGLLAG
jgi:hypothetical protein